MGKSRRNEDDDDLKRLKKLKKLLGEDKLRHELKKVSKKEERKSKKKSKHSSEEVWEEKSIESIKDNKSKSPDDHERDKLEWMYKGGSDLMDSEKYLLGKKVDEAIVRKQKGELVDTVENTSGSVGAIFDTDAGSTQTQAVDMANKLREDPLFMIKQQEINKKKELLNNPVRMKQLQQLLEKSKHGKKKKKKKRKDSSSDDSSDSDHVRKQKQSFTKEKRRYTDSRHSRNEERHRESNHYRKQDSYHRDRDSHRHHPPVRNQRSRSPPDRSRNRHRSRSPRERSSGSAKKIDAKELERRRAEMMENAKSRDEDRKNRVQRYRDDDEAERQAERTKSRKAEFVEPMKIGAKSVEDRIKRNIYNIQRTSAALEKNFAKR